MNPTPALPRHAIVLSWGFGLTPKVCRVDSSRDTDGYYILTPLDCQASACRIWEEHIERVIAFNEADWDDAPFADEPCETWNYSHAAGYHD